MNINVSRSLSLLVVLLATSLFPAMAQQITQEPVSQSNRISNANSSDAIQGINKTEGKVYYLDTESQAYAEHGLWRNTKELNSYGESAARHASAAYNYNKAFFYFDSIPRKKYQLAAWITSRQDTTAQKQTYVIHHGRDIDRINIAQDTLLTNGSWHVLGTYILGPNDYVEIVGSGDHGTIITDAIRLIETTNSPIVPVRGDFRISVLSGLENTKSSWSVDNIIKRIPKIWAPNLVIISGDLIAKPGATGQDAWEDFDQSVAQPLQKAGIPFAFALEGESLSGLTSMRIDPDTYWNMPENIPGLSFIDKTHFPDYYSFRNGNVFFVSMDIASSKMNPKKFTWLRNQFKKPQAQNARMRIVIGNTPIITLEGDQNSQNNTSKNPEELLSFMEQYDVHTFISGNHKSYYPGKRGDLQLLRTGFAAANLEKLSSEEEDLVPTMTILDIFHDEGYTNYSTYKLNEKFAENMELLDLKSFPAIKFGANGYVVRKDMELANQATGKFSFLNALEKSEERGRGRITAQFKNDDLLLSGHYFSLTGDSLKANGIALYKGRNGEKGMMLTTLKNNPSKKGLGTFSGKLPRSKSLKELLSAGALYATLETTDGKLRAQLYPAGNRVPPIPNITSHHGRNIYAVRNIEIPYVINWSNKSDKNGDVISYVYQLSSDRHFNQILLQKKTGPKTMLKMPEKKWFTLLEDSGIGNPVTFYQRIIATDGKNMVHSPVEPLRLLKSKEPLYDNIEIPSPANKINLEVEKTSELGNSAEPLG